MAGYKGSTQGHKVARRIFTPKICEKCGATEDMTIHHRDGDPSNNKRGNLQALCRPCHGKLHNRWEGHKKEKTCLFCGETFIYKRARETTCGLSCANKLAWLKRRGGNRNREESRVSQPG